MSTESSASFEYELRSRLTNTLGSTGRFFVPGTNTIAPELQFRDLLVKSSVDKEIDPVALCEFSGHYAFFGNRTILRHIRRTDWYADDHLQVLDAPVGVPGHDQHSMSPEKIGLRFIDLLLDETRERVRGCRHLGLLLSGGMDSRIVAAALGELQRAGWAFQVTCFNWGQVATRDTVYAEQIASYYGWRFEHFTLNAESLWDNVCSVARNGCFHSAMHLHASSSVASRAAELGVQLMLAGSYGDSVGRAEFSGSHVTALQPIDRRVSNWYGLIDQALFEQCRRETVREISRCRRLYGPQSRLATIELDYQLHYMRNMLGSALKAIDVRIPLAQSFTSRAIVEFMWSLAPESRKDDVYLSVLGQLEPTLLEIPWARTGKPFLQPNARADNLKARFHDYSAWAHENMENIEESIFSSAIERSGAFNLYAVHRIVQAFGKYQFVHSGRIPEIVLWLASLGMLLEELQAPPIRSGAKQKRPSLRHRLQLSASLARQYSLFARGTLRAK